MGEIYESCHLASAGVSSLCLSPNTLKNTTHTLTSFSFFFSHFKPPEGDVISTRPGGERAHGNRSHRYFFFFLLPLACLSLSLQRFLKRRAVIYYYYYYRAAGKFTVPVLWLMLDGEVSRVRHSGDCSALKCSNHTLTSLTH